MNVETMEMGGLKCHVVDTLAPGVPPSITVVLCHGFGAPGTDLVALGPELLHSAPQLAASVRFYFPEAPLSLDDLGMYGGRAWWPLNIERMAAAVENGDMRHLRSETPDGLESARTLLTAFVSDVCETDGIDAGQIVLGGFSQGSMLATDVALSFSQRLAGLCVLSGTLLSEDRWRDLASERGPLPVLQSHGRQDPLLPFVAAQWLRDLLIEGGLSVEFLPFDGMHTISVDTLQRFAEFLIELIPD
ncbi:MAG: alpha/beta fold hydrolase [Planctomycetaceae bacterium]|nr:alpha/beta fold hydrolase [Planctomycetaceae bacterium]MBT6157277.1 alpha/beta fold hydrolase [Planctomycetaceae bacterium]MBT6486799.1 alpha/beta fold hydrolase [Planctomycetaceae bacterium]MBT6493356.1 alpha/beta fold hydrolase [Planctomycetaceae bacterium]